MIVGSDSIGSLSEAMESMTIGPYFLESFLSHESQLSATFKSFTLVLYRPIGQRLTDRLYPRFEPSQTIGSNCLLRIARIYLTVNAEQMLVNILRQIGDTPGSTGNNPGPLQWLRGLIDVLLNHVHSLTYLECTPPDRHDFTSSLSFSAFAIVR